MPATDFDQEEFERLPLGTQVEVKPIDARGHDQLAFYWMVLARVVEATNRWPNKEKLHEALKWDLGYVGVAYNMLGIPRLTVDSISLETMGDDERAVFMEQAWAMIAEVTGIDAVGLLKETRQAA